MYIACINFYNSYQVSIVLIIFKFTYEQQIIKSIEKYYFQTIGLS